MADRQSKTVNARKRRKPPKPGQEHQATVEEFEREGMGVAAKE